LTDTFGPKYAANTNRFRYIAQGPVPFSETRVGLHKAGEREMAVFFIVAALDINTTVQMITVLRSMRAKHIKAD